MLKQYFSACCCVIMVPQDATKNCYRYVLFSLILTIEYRDQWKVLQTLLLGMFVDRI